MTKHFLIGTIFLLFRTKMKTLKIIFNSEIPTEYIRSKMKEHTDRIVEVFSGDYLVVSIHLRVQSSNLRECLQRFDYVAQLSW